mgnify:CR=1 FL=1
MKFKDLIREEDFLIGQSQTRISRIIKKRIIERAKTGKKSEPTKKMRNAIRKETRKTVTGAMKLGMDWLKK